MKMYQTLQDARHHFLGELSWLNKRVMNDIELVEKLLDQMSSESARSLDYFAVIHRRLRGVHTKLKGVNEQLVKCREDAWK